MCCRGLPALIVIRILLKRVCRITESQVECFTGNSLVLAFDLQLPQIIKFELH